MTHRDDSGNVQVDFVWGNIPMQPDDDRYDIEVSFGGGAQDVGWSSTSKYVSDSLRTGDYTRTLNNLEYVIPADSHTIATTGYSNYPAYIENYAGDGDSSLEVIVPDVMRKTRSQAEYILDNVGLNLFDVSHNPEIQYIESTGTTVRVYAYDNNANGDSPLVGLKAGDKVYVDNNLQNFPDLVTITAVNDDLEVNDESWIEFNAGEELNLDDYAEGTIWAGPDLVDVITVIRFWNLPGSIVNENQNIHVRFLGD